jgi:hypothetical protein
MVSLKWAAGLGHAIPESWFPEVLRMSEEKAQRFAKRFPRGQMMLPEAPKPVKKAAPKKKAAKKAKK